MVPTSNGLAGRYFNTGFPALKRLAALGLVPALAVASAVASGVTAAGSFSAMADDRTDDDLRLLALGDSLVAGYGLSPEDGFTAQLESALRAEGWPVTVLDGGVSGDTTAGGLARLDWVLADEPDTALVALGANDGLRGIDPAETRANLDAILARLAGEEGLPTLFAGMYAPPNLGREYEQAFNGLYPDLAAAHNVAFFPFFLEDVAMVEALNQGDGIHPNAEGVAVIVENLLPHVIEVLEQVRSSEGGDG